MSLIKSALPVSGCVVAAGPGTAGFNGAEGGGSGEVGGGGRTLLAVSTGRGLRDLGLAGVIGAGLQRPSTRECTSKVRGAAAWARDTGGTGVVMRVVLHSVELDK